MHGQALVRMPPDLAARVHDLALADGLTDSAWIRGLAATAAGLPDEARPTAASDPPLDLAAFALLGRQVSRLNGALVQLAKAVREIRGETPVWRELEAVLAELRECRDRLAAAAGIVAKRRRRG